MTPKALQLLEEFAEQGTMLPDRRAALTLLLVEFALLRHRVERVRELHSDGPMGWAQAIDRVRRILDGEEP